MKTNIITTIILLITFISCKNVSTSTTGTGRIEFSLEAQDSYITIGTRNSVNPQNSSTDAQSQNINVDDFVVNLYDNKDAERPVELNKWDTYSQVDEFITLEQGEYKFTAQNIPTQQVPNAAFETPFYYGAHEFVLEPQKVNYVTLQCALANVKTTVAFTDKFKTGVKDIVVTILNEQIGEDAGVLPYSVEETRAGYFKVPTISKKLVVKVSGTVISNNKILSQTKTITDPKAKQWHKIKIDLITSGTFQNEISIDHTLVEIDIDIVVPDDDDIIDNNGDNGTWDPDNGTTPTITGESFNGNSFDLNDIVELSKASIDENTILDVKFLSKHNAGITNLYLQIESTNEVLGDMFPDKMDLANATEADSWYSIFADPGIGIIDPDYPMRGKKEHLFSLGALMSLLSALSEVSGDIHTFKLEVVDANGITTANLKIKMVD